MSRLKIVAVPTVRTPLRKSPGFAKKALSDYALDLLALCGYGCRYCSSNNGNYLRIRRSEFAELARQQTGTALTPDADPDLTYVWPDVLERLGEQLQRVRPSYGEGKTVVFSMLTDGFSPHLVADGTTRAALEIVLSRTAFRIRILTKNACVGAPAWTKFFAAHPGRFVVGLSLGTLDDDFARTVEIGTSPPSARAKAYGRLRAAKIPTYGMLCPVFPDALDGDGLDRVLDVVRPQDCEHVWAEPFNDRANWEHVAAGFSTSSKGAALLHAIYGRGETRKWSGYATDLYLRLRARATDGGWLSRLRYLLYEDMIAAPDAGLLEDMEGILLQSKPGLDGYSRNAFVRNAERARGLAPRRA